MPFVRSSEFASGTVIHELVPSNESAPSKRPPPTQVAPKIVPLFELP